MTRNYLLILCVLFSFSACSGCKKSSSKKSDTQVLNSKNDTLADSVLLKNEKKFVFSNPRKKDLFQIHIKGNNILSGVAYFKILDHKGKLIYKDSFKAFDLVNRDELEMQNPNEDERITYIKKRVDDFFDSDKFIFPAIKTSEEFEPKNKIAQKTWLDIKNQKNSVGFQYEIGLHDIKKITYSKKLRKILVYFDCC